MRLSKYFLLNFSIVTLAVAFFLDTLMWKASGADFWTPIIYAILILAILHVFKIKKGVVILSTVVCLAVSFVVFTITASNSSGLFIILLPAYLVGATIYGLIMGILFKKNLDKKDGTVEFD